MQIRRVLLDSQNQELCATAELLLMFASPRAERGPVDSSRALRRPHRAVRPLHEWLKGCTERLNEARANLSAAEDLDIWSFLGS